jgi:hypothetical protein
MAKRTSSHPAFYGISAGDCTGISYVRNGETCVAAGKVRSFSNEGDRLAIDRTGGLGPIVLRADEVQAAIDVKRAADRPKPSEKQVNYALILINRLGWVGWHNSDYGHLPIPTKDDLGSWSPFQMRNLIDDLRTELGELI